MPVTVAGILYMVVFSAKLLPDRLAIQPTSINAREYNVVLVVKPTSSLTKKTVEQAGLTRQPGLHFTHIYRDGTVIDKPAPDTRIMAKDRLHFSGVIDAVLLLTQLDGLALSEDEGEEQIDLNRLNPKQCLVEAVVANGSSMVHKQISTLQLRSRYKVAVVAVHRHGTRLNSAISDIVLEAGDSLLMVAALSQTHKALLVWIYEDDDGENNMYVHHDIMLPAFPLCTSWLDCGLKGGEKGERKLCGCWFRFK